MASSLLRTTPASEISRHHQLAISSRSSLRSLRVSISVVSAAICAVAKTPRSRLIKRHALWSKCPGTRYWPCPIQVHQVDAVEPGDPQQIIGQLDNVHSGVPAAQESQIQVARGAQRLGIHNTAVDYEEFDSVLPAERAELPVGRRGLEAL